MESLKNREAPGINRDVTKVVIVGAGGFGREVLEIFKDQNKVSKKWDILGFIDDNKQSQGAVINDYPVLGGLDWLQENHKGNMKCVVAIGTCETRRLVTVKLEKMGMSFCNIIHPSVIMSEFVKMGEGVIICAGSILTVNIEIGCHTHININSTIGHDAVIGAYSTINPTAIINGNNVLGEGVYVGTGATFIQGVSVGDWSTIGAGAVVVRDIPEKVVAVGVPARVIKIKETTLINSPESANKRLELQQIS
jgi:sugar O-acyltransferase (sialic acid O-acetyltransferase NeuD family)